ncbi:hypothetical protein ASG31_07115 [Chryseobacterium sp. Leaf404]|uniref:DUF7674 family protein n=1 Tax=unclassified Chryseobacterium TaxID=2593645 RepID=UPI0006F5593F|nr:MULTISPECIES: hypothetical protein [unclassified Chryseobacterium]KQT18483.1 hypothetical protein ASG31_07115 [Chryseobacterium sp. Leaf404]
MNCTEATQEIIEIIPDVKGEFTNQRTAVTPYKVISIFTGQIKNLIVNNDRTTLRRCIQKMNRFYRYGDQSLKNAIENNFIYSLDSFTFCCEPAYKKMIFNRLSSNLQNNYLRQVYKSGI